MESRLSVISWPSFSNAPCCDVDGHLFNGNGPTTLPWAPQHPAEVTSTQCKVSFTDLNVLYFLSHLQPISFVKFKMLLLDSYSALYLKVKTSVRILNMTLLVATSDLIIDLFSQTYRYRSVKE